jgi:hypothetical protein
VGQQHRVVLRDGLLLISVYFFIIVNNIELGEITVLKLQIEKLHGVLFVSL